jgi:hypothetical protein
LRGQSTIQDATVEDLNQAALQKREFKKRNLNTPTMLIIGMMLIF